MDKNLLDEVAKTMDILCLSDLQAAMPEELYTALKAFPAADYSTEQWSYTLSYILRRQVSITGEADVERTIDQMNPSCSCG